MKHFETFSPYAVQFLKEKRKFSATVKSASKEALLVTGTESLVQSDRTRQIYCYHGQIGMRCLTKFVIVSIL